MEKKGFHYHMDVSRELIGPVCDFRLTGGQRDIMIPDISTMCSASPRTELVAVWIFGGGLYKGLVDSFLCVAVNTCK